MSNNKSLYFIVITILTSYIRIRKSVNLVTCCLKLVIVLKFVCHSFNQANSATLRRTFRERGTPTSRDSLNAGILCPVII